MERPTRLVIATHNPGKLAEMEALLAPRGIAVVGAGDLSLPEPAETEETFEGNAAIKAEAARDATGLPAIADDSGFCVDALGGRPGVRAKEFADGDYPRAMATILTEVGDGLRGAQFVSVIAYARPEAPTAIFRGEVAGQLADGPRGPNGFGYDPLFVPDEGDGRTFGEMSREEKGGGARPLSHRARALAAFLEALP